MKVSLTAFLFLSNCFLASGVVCWAATSFSCRRISRQTVKWQKKITTSDRLVEIITLRNNSVLLTRSRTVWNTENNHDTRLATSKRPSVTRLGYEKVCFMAMYRSKLSKTRWKSDELSSTIKAHLRTCRTQYPRGSSSNNMINTAAKAGWTRIPTVKSVKARSASKISWTCALLVVILP